MRELAREQAISVAHVNKIYRTQQAALVAARGAAQQGGAPPGQQGPPPSGQGVAGPGFMGPISYPVLPSQHR